ncbi:carboxymuconolactone decarboxylase family protein [Fodinicola acaciae]|uniref:carboxymuconolactone decarboxylase family protein n=1 Tax=Fodinicola acaciae TaxID=2681555 RepID=UPI0013D0388C|nr:carboxymuconolactone decarboxylase family protein [Fodinicola acaciae]
MTLSQQTGKLDRDSFQATLAFFTELDLVTADESAEVLAMFEPDFAYARAMARADSVHVHVKVPEVADLPHHALTAREKALIGLALAHAHRCPYCIDSFTNTCLDKDITVEQIHEVIHTSSALAAGVHFVHGVQTRNVLARRGML